jgi:hypothetical protein
MFVRPTVLCWQSRRASFDTKPQLLIHPRKKTALPCIDSLNASRRRPITTDAGQVRVFKDFVTWRLVREWRYSSLHSNSRQFTAIKIKSGRLRSTTNIWYSLHMRLSWTWWRKEKSPALSRIKPLHCVERRVLFLCKASPLCYNLINKVITNRV